MENYSRPNYVGKEQYSKQKWPSYAIVLDIAYASLTIQPFSQLFIFRDNAVHSKKRKRV